MDVTCERCGTEYEFDETLVAARGTTVKCTNCGHLFKVFRSGASAAAGSAEGSRAWAVRRAGIGGSESISSLKELQRRIAAGELTPDDEITRTGEGWKRLGDIAELQTFFVSARAPRSDRPPSERPSVPGREGTGTRRDPAARDAGALASRPETLPFAATEAMPVVRPDSAPPSGAPPRPGKSTMLGLGGPAPSVRPGAPVPREAPPRDDAKGRTLEMAVPPPASAPAPARASSSGGTAAPRTFPDPASSSSGGLRAPPPPPRAAPPSVRPPPPPAASTPAPVAPRAIPPTSLGPLADTPAPAAARPPSGRPPAAERARGAVRPLHVDDDDHVPARPRGRSRSGIWAALVLLLAIGGGVAAGWDRLQGLFAGGPAEDPAAPLVAAGDRALRLDHERAYEDAIAQYTQALAIRERDARVLTGLSRAHALVAQQLLFRATDLELGAAADPALRAQASELRQGASSHAAQAREHAEAAARHGAGDADAEVALSDAMRLSGDPALARSRLDRARTLRSEPSAESLRVEALLAADQAGNVAAARSLAERAVAEDPGLLRARMLLARAQLGAGELSAAQAQLQAVLDRIADHPDALALRRAIEEGSPPAAPVVADAGTPIAATPAPAQPQPTAPAALPPVAPPPVAPPPAAPAQAATPQASTETAASRGYDALVREAEQRLENGDTRRARALFEQASRERAGGVEALAGLGFVMLAEGNARGALTPLQNAVDRGYADALIGVGDAHRRLNQREQALAAYERYLERLPSGPRASIARRQAERLRSELGAAPAAAPAEAETSSPTHSETPVTAPDELPAPRGATEPPPQDVPAIDSEP